MKLYDRLVANERLKYLNAARRLVYPDVRAVYLHHERILYELAKAIYVAEQLAKDGGGERSSQLTSQPNVWESEI